MEKTFNLETELTINSVSTTLKAMLWPLVTNTETVPLRKITTWGLDTQFQVEYVFRKKQPKSKKGEVQLKIRQSAVFLGSTFKQKNRTFPGFFCKETFF